ncbi:MAG: hypothetical protein HGB12_00955 [Bacteroidetes bacterium]|nr:hypothetical protein [Bacteroidota bacterium]
MGTITKNTKPKNDKKIRFGILCNGLSFKAWQVKVIEKLLESDETELCLLIINSQIPEKKAFLKKIVYWLEKNFIYKFYTKYFYKPHSTKEIDLSQKFENIPKMKCSVIMHGKFSEYFSDEDVAFIKNNELDFMMRFGFNIIRGEILNASKYGIWSFHHDDEEKYRGGPAGLWEIYNNDPINGVILQRLTDKLDSGIILKKGWFETIKHSYQANTDSILYNCSSWPLQICVDIKNGVSDYIAFSPSSSKAKIYTYPSNIQMLKFISKILVNKIKFHYNELFRTEHWNIGITKTPLNKIIKSGISEKEIKWLPAQKSQYFRADSFAYIYDNKINIFFESFNYKTRKGSISKMTFSDITGFSDEKLILEKPYHLSYPYIFENNDELFCIPESFENNQADLYKIDKSTGHLQFYKTLLENTDAVDSTIVKHDDIWWLFCTKKSNEPNVNLYLYYSANFDGPYISHPANPVKSDIRSARPAGIPFVNDNILYRPAQDSSRTYGGKITLNKITKLNTFEFKEETVGYVFPINKSKYNLGIHTVCGLGEYTIFDAKKHTFVSAAFIYHLGRKVKKLCRINK